MQFYYDNSLHRYNLVRYSGYVDGRICDSQSGRFLYTLLTETATVFFHTDASGSGSRGFELSFKAMGKSGLLNSSLIPRPLYNSQIFNSEYLNKKRED